VIGVKQKPTLKQSIFKCDD